MVVKDFAEHRPFAASPTKGRWISGMAISPGLPHRLAQADRETQLGIPPGGKLQDLVALLSGRNVETKQFEEVIAEESFARLKKGIVAFINKTHSTTSP